MAWQIINADRTTQMNLGVTDSVTLMAGINLSSNSGAAINSDGNGNQVFIYGMVASSSIGLYLGANTTTNSANIGAGGTVFGADAGVRLSGSAHKIENRGEISSGVSAVLLGGLGDSDKIVNYGNIIGGDIALQNVTFGSGIVRLSNYGTMTGGRLAYDASTASSIDWIANSGTITGDVLLGNGMDIFQNKGAGVVDGTVYGGAGSDSFYLGAGHDVIYGGSEQDFLVFSNEAGVKIALDLSFDNTGSAKGDYIREVEGIYGSAKGSDYIRGDQQANIFYGGGGTDSLYGGANNDTLSGDAGKDILYGGTGSDTFYFATLSDGGDKINDFSNITGNNDRIQIAADELGIAGIIGARALLASEFYKGTTNICTGAEDRIILRTTDNTVWFDTNGKASGGLTLLADLQSGVTVTYADFAFV